MASQDEIIALRSTTGGTASISAVVFDLGGVLIDWNPDYLYGQLIPDVHERERFLSTICTPEWNHEMDAGRSVPESVAALALVHPEYSDLIAAWWTRWPEMLGSEFTDTLQLAQHLSQGGVPLYALTNFASDTWPMAVARFPFLSSLFDGVVVSGDEKVAKPDRAIFELARDRFGLDPLETAFIDDKKLNVEAARNVGFRSHHFTSAARLSVWFADKGLVDTP